MRRAWLMVPAAIISVAMFATGTAPASAEWIEHPYSNVGQWWCEYYGAEYWCYAPDVQTGEWSWFRAAPGWQYGPLGG
jgi:hypothetical protein